MFKRNESKPESSRRRDRKDRVNKKRRLLMEDLEARRLLATLNLPTYDGPRNVGTVQATQFLESETILEVGRNDAFANADVVPLGTGPGQDNTIDVIGTLPFQQTTQFPPRFTVDLDTYAVDLRAGDILDISAQGAAGEYSVFFEDGTLWFGVNDNQAIGAYPVDSPLQDFGNAVFAQTVPRDGRYFITVSPFDTSNTYTLGLRAYRPSIESAPIGTRQIIFVDFDGGTYPRAIFNDFAPTPGIIRLPSLRESLPLLGIQAVDDASFNRLIDLTMAETERMFNHLGISGTNGDFNSTGNPGDFGVTILNSRDHADPGLNNPLVTRVIIGGTVADSEIATIGISSTLDVGNFSMDDIVIGLLDGVLGVVGGVPLAPTASIIDQMGDFLAFLVAHEAAHSFGMRHTASAMSPAPFPDNEITNIIDEGPGADFGQVIGAGPDGIFGTIDDVDVNFVEDRFSYREGLVGQNHTDDSLSQTLATGTRGGGITGFVFNDSNSDGRSDNDDGIAGVSVFADINGNGVRDSDEPFSVTAEGGIYTLIATPGDYNIVVNVPPNVTPTTPSIVPVSVSDNQQSSVVVDFGLTSILGGTTGFAFSDNNGNGTREAGEVGVAGIYHYIDLDRDNRPDLGEPSAVSGADGSYNIDFPGAGNYTVRQVVPPGFTQTSPVSGEHTFQFDGVSLTQNYNFGLLPSRDFGDAPDTYGTTIAADGASHGITDGLYIGLVDPDRDSDGQPSDDARGDDDNGRILQTGAIEDDEDGVFQVDPLGPGARAEFRITVTNTSGSPGYLQGFMDFNDDGDFEDAGEQFLTDIFIPVGTQDRVLDASDGIFVDVPADAATGSVYARFRLAQESGLGPKGSTDTGEVEDYRFTVLDEASIVVDDNFSVSRNSLANRLDILGNDFQTDDFELFINATSQPIGEVVIAQDEGSIFYTPPNGFTGRDAFTYSVKDASGNVILDDNNQPLEALVIVNVNFQSAVPIALDDSFEVPENAVNRALNVLDNDVPSTSGGLSIISVTPGSAGGTIRIIGGGQSLRYTPLPGFNGTEQFTYAVQDSAGLTSTAQVTVNLLPGTRNDDVVDFDVSVLSPLNTNQELDNVQVGDKFLVRITVDHIEAFANPRGVASAFLDLLYSDQLVGVSTTGQNVNFPFDIAFGDQFSGAGTLQSGNADIPGLIDEVGGIQSINASIGDKAHDEPIVLFDLMMEALSPGVAVFSADPADSNISETTTLGSDTALPVNALRLGSTELLIVPRTDNFASAIDDSFADGNDSNGNPFSSGVASTLDVLENDILGPTGIVREFGLVTNPSKGSVTINTNGTTTLNDDTFTYTPGLNQSGLDSFTYVLVTDDGIRSTAEVTIPLGGGVAQDVEISYRLVDESGNPIPSNTVNVGQRFGVEVVLEDTRFNPSFVFAAFHDLTYTSSVISTTDTVSTDGFDFDVDIENGYSENAAVGTNARVGLIDEFGTLFSQATFPSSDVSHLNPITMATIFFEATTTGTARIVGGPADTFPAHETLLLREDDPVAIENIKYNVLEINVEGALGPQQNLALPQDVNADGEVTPRDALIVINAMERQSNLFQGDSPGAPLASEFYTDVNGDTRLSALDALQVINYLAIQSNLQTVQAEQVETGTDLGSSSNADAAFAILNDSDLVVDASAPSSDAVVESSTGSDAGDDDEDDDVLALLANDVADAWN